MDEDSSERTVLERIRPPRGVHRLASAIPVGLVLLPVLVALLGATAPVRAAGPDLPPELRSNFVSRCLFSHRNRDDPIVFPRQPGRSHDHTYFGSRSTNAFSTVSSLRRSATSCDRGDTAAYWAPTLFVGGKPVRPARALAYYERRVLDPVRPFPLGLKAIAGDPSGLRGSRLDVVAWGCGVVDGGRLSVAPVSCADGTGGTAVRIRFPSCWDGRRLDTSDHASHLAYPVQLACPRSHAVALPALSLVIQYGSLPRGSVRLASGRLRSMHADFVNAWDPTVLAQHVDSCLNRPGFCGGLPSPE